MVDSEIANSLLASLFASEGKKVVKKEPLANSTNLPFNLSAPSPANLQSPLPVRFKTEPQAVKSETDEDYSPTNRPQSVTKPRVTGNRQKIHWCQVCNVSLLSNGGRSQGPRRHILKDHLMKKMYLCPFCDFGSNYDKAHVHAHMKKMHSGKDGDVTCLDRNTYAEEEAVWMEKCFGKKDSGEDSPEPAVSTPTPPCKYPQVASQTPIQRKNRMINRGVKPPNSSALAAPDPLPFYQNTLANFLETICNEVRKYQEELGISV